MRWLVGILVLDLVIAGLLISRVAKNEEPDFTFVCENAHRFLDPQRMSWLHDIRVARCLFEPLTRVQLPNMDIEPAAAERWQISEDGLTYTFFIRPNSQWSNADPLRADDFVYAWRRALMPDLASDYSQLLWTIEGAESFFRWREEQLADYAQDDSKQSIETAQAYLDRAHQRFEEMVEVGTLDERTLRVKLARRVPYFLQLCAFATFMPVHRSTVESQTSLHVETGRLIQDPYWTRPDRLVCNGPYRLARRRFKRDLFMVANEHHWNRAALGTTRIHERIIANPSTALLLYEAGKVDWLPDIPSAGSLAGNLVSQNRIDVHVTAAAGTYFYNFNCLPTLADGAKNPLADFRVRRALSMAIDREGLIKNITRLGQPPAYTFVPVGSLPQYDPPVEAGCAFDPDAARKLLAEAGFGNGGKRLSGLSILYNTAGSHKQIAQAIKRMWSQHLEVDVKLEGLESMAFGDRLRNHDFTIARAGWFGDYLDPTTFLDKFKTDNGNNDAAYANPKFDALMHEASTQHDTSVRMKTLRRAEAIMLADQPIAPIYQYVNFNVFDPERVRGLQPNAWKSQRLEQVRFD